MKITQFKNMLAIHGTDFSRWDDVDPADAQAFMSSSDKARVLFEEAQALDNALDSYGIEQVSPALLQDVMQKIGGTVNEAEAKPAVATVHKFTPKNKQPVIMRPVFWGGMTAVAAAVILFVSSLAGPQSSVVLEHGNTVVAQLAQQEEQVLATIEQIAEEEVYRIEILAMLDQVKHDESEGNIDRFLNELYDSPADRNAGEELDLWELFQKSQGTAEL